MLVIILMFRISRKQLVRKLLRIYGLWINPESTVNLLKLTTPEYRKM
jgi:hypothetical protein